MINFFKNIFFRVVFYLSKNTKKNPYIYSIEETIQRIVEDKVSVSRYGDGELKWMCGLKQNSFQTNSPILKERLIEIIKSNESQHIVCLTDVFGDLSQYTKESQTWWKVFMGKFRYIWLSFLQPEKKYYNTNITRPYMDYKDKSKSIEIFDQLKSIWSNRNIMIIEGEKTRLGVGNDLFSNANSIQRVICPSVNAFDKYSSILESAVELATPNSLILIALGPTATVLAYDLFSKGYQAIDIGHVDVEYEWFLMGANEKKPIEGKYVNEAKDLGGIQVKDSYDTDYVKSIIKYIK